MTVLDGDTQSARRGARVTIGDRSARTNRLGVAASRCCGAPHSSRAVEVRLRATLGAAAVQHAPKSTLRVYRRSLQWTMYGAARGARSRRRRSSVRPPFRVVWSRGLGTLIEFPAVVSDGVAYIANARGTVRALSMRTARSSGGTTRRTGRWRPRPRSWATSSSSTGWTGTSGCSRRSNGGSSGATTSARRSSRRRSSSTGSTTSARGTGRSTRSTCGRRVRWRRTSGCKITSSAAVAGGDALHRRLLRPAARAAASTAARWSRSVNGRSTARPRSPTAACSSRPRPAARSPRSPPAAALWRRSTGSMSTRRPRSPMGACSSARTTALLYAVSAVERSDAVGASAGRPDLRAPPSSWPASPTPARSRTASSASTLAPAGVLPIPPRRVRTGLRQAAAACSCTGTRASTRSSTR